jgi:ornithine cyclodeaminase/alanine dehydrogenase-like protein (mu-crystallin family)
MRVLSDADVDRVPMARLVAAVREQIIADAQGEAVAPPRHVVPFREGSLVFTIGGDRRLAGFRAYQTFARPGHSADTQVVAAWDQVKAEMLGLALGNRLGALRTGAIGGAAADILAPKAARILAIVGTGRQAETQLLGLTAVRDFAEIRVCGRRAEAVAAFADAQAARIGRPILPFTDPRAALEGADVVVLATTSKSPVIEADWVAAHAYVATLGPSAVGAHELPLALADRARLIVTDSPQQLAGMGDDHMLSGLEPQKRIKHLGAIAADERGQDYAPALFLSIGLAGTEVACLAACLDHIATA